MASWREYTSNSYWTGNSVFIWDSGNSRWYWDSTSSSNLTVDIAPTGQLATDLASVRPTAIRITYSFVDAFHHFGRGYCILSGSEAYCSGSIDPLNSNTQYSLNTWPENSGYVLSRFRLTVHNSAHAVQQGVDLTDGAYVTKIELYGVWPVSLVVAETYHLHDADSTYATPDEDDDTVYPSEPYHEHAADAITLEIPVADLSAIRLYQCSTWTQGSSQGGAISSTEIEDDGQLFNTIFPDVSNTDRVAGLVDYRKVFIKNTSDIGCWFDVLVWISTNTTSDGDSIAIALGTDSDVQTDADDYTYYQPTSKTHEDVLEAGDLLCGESIAVWIRRTVNAYADPSLEDEFVLAVGT